MTKGNQRSDSKEITNEEIIKKYREWKKHMQKQMVTTKDGMKLPADIAKGIPTLQYVELESEIRRQKGIEIKSKPKQPEKKTMYSSQLGLKDMFDSVDTLPYKKQFSDRNTWFNNSINVLEDGNINENVRLEMNNKQKVKYPETSTAQLEEYNKQMLKRKKIAEQEAYLKYLHDETEKGRIGNETDRTNLSNRQHTAKYSAIARPEFKSVERYMRESQKKEERNSKFRNTFLKRLIATFEESKKDKQTNITTEPEFPAVTRLMKKEGNLPLQKKKFIDKHPTFARFWRKFKGKINGKPEKLVTQGETILEKRKRFIQDLHNNRQENGGDVQANTFPKTIDKINQSVMEEDLTL